MNVARTPVYFVFQEDRDLSRGLALHLHSDRVKDLTSLYTSVGIADYIVQNHHEGPTPGNQPTVMFQPMPMMFIQSLFYVYIFCFFIRRNLAIKYNHTNAISIPS